MLALVVVSTGLTLVSWVSVYCDDGTSICHFAQGNWTRFVVAVSALCISAALFAVSRLPGSLAVGGVLLLAAGIAGALWLPNPWIRSAAAPYELRANWPVAWRFGLGVAGAVIAMLLWLVHRRLGRAHDAAST
jgi:hypothetical protein